MGQLIILIFFLQEENRMFYMPELGRFLSRDMILRPAANPYVYAENNPARYTDPTGLWDEAGHFYTTYIIAKASGMTNAQAFELAYYSQLPDEVPTYDATHAGKQLIGNEAFRIAGAGLSPTDISFYNDIQQLLHSLHTGDVNTRRKCLQDLLKGGGLEPWEMGLIIHALGDAYAHTYRDDQGVLHPYGPGIGHGFKNVPQFASPDDIANHPATYRNYVRALYGVLSPGGNPSTIDSVLNLSNDLVRDPVNQIGKLRTLAQNEFGYNDPYAPESSDTARLPAYEALHKKVTRQDVMNLMNKIRNACVQPCQNAPSTAFNSAPK
jgi:hypothetical protein